MKRSIVALAFALAAGLLVAVPVSAATTVGDVEKELMCQCGCTMVLDTCQCGTADQMRALIGEKIDGGQSKNEIMDYFVAQYGETILSAPTKKGFNLMVWILPFAAIAGGGVALYFILRIWVLKGKAQKEAAIPQPGHEEDGDEYREKFEQELEDFRREEDDT